MKIDQRSGSTTSEGARLPDARDLDESFAIRLGRAIHIARRRMIEDGEAAAATDGLEVAHLQIIHVLGLRGSMCMGDVAARVVIAPASMTRRAKQLEKLGLVERQRSEASNREVEISLTAAGEDVFQRSFHDVHDRHEKYFDAHLTPDEQERLLALLSKLS